MSADDEEYELVGTINSVDDFVKRMVSDGADPDIEYAVVHDLGESEEGHTQYSVKTSGDLRKCAEYIMVEVGSGAVGLVPLDTLVENSVGTETLH